MSAPLQARPNPYVGPRPFQYGEPLFGRDREAMELLDLLIAERIVLLYSPSGAGKTSLMQAALIPELEKEGFQVLPVMRVSLEPPPELARSAIANRYVLSLLLSLEEALPAAQQMPLAELAGMELAAYLDRRSMGADESEPLVLIFDQFEEILTVDPTDRTAKEAFFAQVGAALRQRQRWALFAMREEYPAGLDPYLRPIPTRLSTTFRLELLEEAAARLAMEQPARQVGVDFTDAAARQLVNDLRRVRVQRPDGTTEEQPGLYVEPVQLQVVCRRLWEKLPADATQIGEEDVAAAGDVDSALSGYYAERVEAIAGQAGVRERAIREWFDRYLITPQGIRGQVLQGHAESEGLENRAITPLVDAHLVRAEKRRGATWFELVHDRLIEPVRQNNAAWFQANLSTLQRQAALWEEQHRSSGLLLRDEALVEAERWADSQQDELTSTESGFLAACREVRAIAERERRQTSRLRRRAIVAIIVSVMAIIAFVVAYMQSHKAYQAQVRAEERQVEAERLQKISIAQAVSAQALREQDQHKQDERAALLARQAFIFHQRGQGHLLDQVDIPLRTVLSAPYFSAVLQVYKEQMPESSINRFHGVIWVAFSPDGKTLAAAAGSTVQLWDMSQPNAHPTVLGSPEGGVIWVAFSPDGKTLAAAGSSTVQLWDVSQPNAHPTVLGSLEGEFEWGGIQWGVVIGVAFSPDGKTLAAAGGSTVQLWDVSQPNAHPTVLGGMEGAVKWVAFSPDGKTLATIGGSTVQLWDVSQPSAHPTVLPHEGDVNSIAFSPDGQLLATIGGSTVQLWDVSQPNAHPTVLGSLEGAVKWVAFSPDGKTLAAAGGSTVQLWDVSQPSVNPTVLPHEADVNSIAFSPDGKTLAASTLEPTVSLVSLWELDKLNATPTILRSYEYMIYSLAFSPDGKTLASGNYAGTVRLWDMGQPYAVPTILHHPGKGEVRKVAFSPDGQLLASAGGSTVQLWDVSQPSAHPTVLPHEGDVNSIAFSPDGQLLASAGGCTAQLWNVGNSRAELTALHDHESCIISLAFSPDGQLLASGSGDKTVRLWDVNRLNAEPTVLHHVGILRDDLPVRKVTFSPDGQLLASVGGDTVQLWNVSQPNAHPTVLASDERGIGKAEGAGEVTSVAFSPDGQLLASVGGDTVQLWNVSQPSAQPTVLASDERGIGKAKGAGEVTSVAFSPDGKILATVAAIGDSTIRLWAVGQPGAQPIILRNDKEETVTSIAFSPDGKILAAAAGSTVQLWDVGQPSANPTVLRHEESVKLVAFSPNGQLLASGSGDKTLRLWAYTDTLANMVCEKVWRNLTLDEWGRFVGADIPYERTCSNLPVHPSFIEAGKQLAYFGDVDGAVAIFQRALALDPSLTLNPQAEAYKLAAPALVAKGQQLASAGDVDGAVAIFQRALALDPSLTLNPQAEAHKLAAPALVAKGQQLAQAGDMQGAMATFRKALALDSALSLEPQAEAKKWVVQGLVAKGQQLAQAGDMQGAMATFRKALALDSALSLEPQAEAKKWAALGLIAKGQHLADVRKNDSADAMFLNALALDPTLVEAKERAAPAIVRKGEWLVKQGKVAEALAAYVEARTLDPTVKISANSWNRLCWFGSLWGYAADVMQTCEQAVTLAPENGAWRDGRGLARALTGNVKGAIEDFQAFITWAEEEGEFAQERTQRHRWIDEFRAGTNPITPEEIKTLWGQ